MGCGAYVRKHAVDDGICGREQAHGVAFGCTQPRSFFGNFTDAVVSWFDLVGNVEIDIG